MSSTFSERFGYKEKREFLQVESIDQALQNSLWNIFYIHVLRHLPLTHPYWPDTNHPFWDHWGQSFILDLHMNFFCGQVDVVDYQQESSVRKLKQHFLSL